MRLASASLKSAENFVARLALAEARIEARPRTYRLLHDRETRRYSFKINRISYLIDYLIEPDQILVLRIWHGRQERPH
jgi:plasmid stabilization system protein ParE